MSDSINWRDGISEAQVSGTVSKINNANGHVLKGEESLMRAGRELRIALRSHLKGDKARFAAACAELFNRGASVAYEYVQAADAHEAFGTDVVNVIGASEAAKVGVRTWAKLDRFTGSDDKVAEGRAVIQAEAVRDISGDEPGRFTNKGLHKTIQTARGTDGNVSPVSDRKIANLEGKLEGQFEAHLTVLLGFADSKSVRDSIIAALRVGASWGAEHGALTEVVIGRLYGAMVGREAADAAEAAKAAKQAAKDAVKLEAAKAAREESSKLATPTVKMTTKPVQTSAIEPKAAAPKRTRKTKATA